jgi:iron(III) transport system substrate-binding protein
MRTVGLAVTVVALLVAACQSAAPAATPRAAPEAAGPASAPAADTRPAEVQRLVAAARERGETELNVSWGNSLGGPEGVRRFEALFNRLYGTNVRIIYTPGPSMPDTAGKVAQELAAGQPAHADVLIATESVVAALLGRDVLEPYDYTLLSPRITSEIVAPRQVAVEIRASAPVISYNTDLVRSAQVPRTLEDVLHPMWKGRIASAPDVPYFNMLAYKPGWDVDRLTAFLTRLSDQVAGLLRPSESSRVVSGEFAMLVLASTDTVRALQSQGAPLGGVIPEDAAQLTLNYLGVPRNSAHPNLAKLFVDMVVSEPGQEIVYEMTFTDHVGLPGSRTADELVALRAKGVQPVKLDVQFYLDHPEIQELTSLVSRVLRERSSR